jgi:hypothetical protein
MRVIYALTIATGLAVFVPTVAGFQMDPDRVIPGGGITVAGWTGAIDKSSQGQGRVLNDAKFAAEGADFHVTTGPAVTYWNPANKAAGDYTVKATFTEPKYMDLNSHPHSYGIMIGGNDLGTDKASYLYCAAYGNGTFIVRGFGPVPPPPPADAPPARGGPPTGAFSVNGRGASPSDSVHKAADKGQPVTQEIALAVKGDSVSCSINGTVVGTYPKADLLTAARMKSTDGVYGLRFTHNVEAIVKGFAMTK